MCTSPDAVSFAKELCTDPMKLINTTELLESLFTEQSRPSKRTWKRRVEDGLIPHTRIGGRLY